ncbi:MAG: GNAT family N-acetyltransferase [Pseudomonadota bacterium]
MNSSRFNIVQIGPNEPGALRKLLAVFAVAFDDAAHYTGKQPDDDYLERLLAKSDFFALAAYDNQQLIGGLTAYELQKYEQSSSELYLYDLAVAEAHRRNRIATRLIESLRAIASDKGCSVVYVQADREDKHAIALYSALGKMTDVVHFEFEPAR